MKNTTLQTPRKKARSLFILSTLLLLLSTNVHAQDTLFFENFNDADCAVLSPDCPAGVSGCRDSVLFMDTTYRGEDLSIIRVGALCLEIPLDTFPLYNGDTYELEFTFFGDAVGDVIVYTSSRRTNTVSTQPVYTDGTEITKIQLDDFVYIIKVSFTYKGQGTKLFDLLSVNAEIVIDVPTFSNPSIDNLKLSLKDRVVGLSETSEQSEDEILTHIDMQGKVVEQPYENQLLIRVYTSGRREKIIYKPQF